MLGSEVVVGDLISRAAVLDAIDNERKLLIEREQYGAEHVVVHHARRIIEELPAVDAAPVVRCKDCKYAHMTYDGECKYCDFWQEDGGDALYLDKSFYCAAGERRDGDTNG